MISESEGAFFLVRSVNELTKFTEHNRNQPQRLLVFQLTEIL